MEHRGLDQDLRVRVRLGSQPEPFLFNLLVAYWFFSLLFGSPKRASYEMRVGGRKRPVARGRRDEGRMFSSRLDFGTSGLVIKTLVDLLEARGRQLKP